MGLQWGDRRTYLKARSFDLVVAADVLYGGRDRWFARALCAHIAPNTTAYVAIPPRQDSPLAGFFSALVSEKLAVERFEDSTSRPIGLASGHPDMFADGRFNLLTEERCKDVAASATEHGAVHIFRITPPSHETV